MAQEWDRVWAGQLNEGWQSSLPSFPAGKDIATRSAGQKVMAAFAGQAPTMIGGAADLVESTKTDFEGFGQFSRGTPGATCPFGIREHGMGAIVNGAAAHGGHRQALRLDLPDLLRLHARCGAPVRLMGLPVLWVWTHDSVALGEDGPTHQPVEHYAALRAIPQLWVVRPADANETTQAWRVALERTDGPVALLLTRQNLPVFDREGEGLGAASELEQGGYVLWDSRGASSNGALAGGEGAPGNGAFGLDLILIATGSEVAPTLEAARALAGEGTSVRVVSMPCMELFEAQTPDYRDEVLPPDVTARLAAETGATMSWWKWVGTHGDVLGLDHFGASAPGAIVLKEFGFDAENIAKRARALAQRRTLQDIGDPDVLPDPLPLHRLSALGQSVWVDFLSRGSIRGGHLQELLDRDAVVGATSNPSIFQKAMTEGDAYDEQLAQLTGEGLEGKEVFWRLAERDIKDACDLFRPIWEAGSGRDGYVSLEVDPDLAYDGPATFAEAMRLHEVVDRANLMVKIPATKPGLAAIEDAIAAGKSINVTLIFSLRRYAEVAESYVRGLERLVAGGGDPSKVASVASFFVSRIDTEADRRLDEIGGHEHLKGKLAVANARLAYQHYRATFRGPAWQFLAGKGATPQRVLWASTSTKNPAYPDVLYVEELIGPDTVNTMPEETIAAYQDHGRPQVRLEDDLSEAKALIAELAAAGVDYDDVTETLEREGVEKFAEAFGGLLAALEQKRSALAVA